MKNLPSINKPIKKAGKKSAHKKKPLPGKTVRVPGVDKGKVIVKPNFDDPLPEFE